MMKDVIKKVLDRMIPVVCEGIEEKDIDDIKESYIKKITDRYSNIDVRLKLNDYDKILKIICDMEYKEWSKLSPNMKKSLLIFDLALNKIIDISNTGLELARKKIENNAVITEEYAEEQIKKMNEFLGEVREENKIVAMNYISEGTVDFTFATGKTEYMSLRIGRYNRK